MKKHERNTQSGTEMIILKVGTKGLSCKRNEVTMTNRWEEHSFSLMKTNKEEWVGGKYPGHTDLQKIWAEKVVAPPDKTTVMKYNLSGEIISPLSISCPLYICLCNLLLKIILSSNL